MIGEEEGGEEGGVGRSCKVRGWGGVGWGGCP